MVKRSNKVIKQVSKHKEMVDRKEIIVDTWQTEWRIDIWYDTKRRNTKIEKDRKCFFTCGMWSATDRVPEVWMRFSWTSNLSEDELKTHSNFRFWEGFAMTSQLTWIRSLFATPYTLTCPGLQNGLSEII